MFGIRAGLARALCAILAAWPTASSAQSSDRPVPSDPLFNVLTTDGSTATGRLRQFGSHGELTLVTAAGIDKTYPIASLVKISRQTAIPALVPEASVVLFPEGDRLYRTAIGAANETTLDVQSFSLGHLAIPLESVLGLVLALPTDSDALEGLIRKVREEPRTSEILWLANGDRLTGGFLGLTERQVEFQPAKEMIQIERTGVVALGFDPTLVAYPKPASGFYELTLSDGSRLGVIAPRIEQGNIVATSRFQVAIKAPLAEVVRLHARTSTVVYLSEREPGAVQYVPYVGPSRPYRKDANVEGHSMRISGADFERGIGTESRTLLAYVLKPGDKRFQAQVGVDDRAGPLGNVIFRVLVDNVERFASPPLSPRDASKLIDLDLTGAKRLILVTEFGERGGVRDFADWGEARIIR